MKEYTELELFTEIKKAIEFMDHPVKEVMTIITSELDIKNSKISILQEEIKRLQNELSSLRNNITIIPPDFIGE